MPIVPLFETLDDLDRAPKVMDRSGNCPGIAYSDQDQTVMIGYQTPPKTPVNLPPPGLSTRLKRIWSAWPSATVFSGALPRSRRHCRNAAAAQWKAMASQPPARLKAASATEQGEMIRCPPGMPHRLQQPLHLRDRNTSFATVASLTRAKPQWRELIEAMSHKSLKATVHSA